MQQQITNKLTHAFNCTYLQVDNESHQHARGENSHFKVTIVSDDFADQRLLQRHRAINSTLADELSQIHALAIHAYTPTEFTEKQGAVPNSPNCLGGSKFD